MKVRKFEILMTALAFLIASSLSYAASGKTSGSTNKSATTQAKPAESKSSSNTSNSAAAKSESNTNPQASQGNLPPLTPAQLEQIMTSVQQQAKPQTGEQINWDVIASGGGPMTSTNYMLDGTLGQTVAGESSSTNYMLNSGYWQNFGVDFICGDVDASHQVDITDAVYIINYIFAGGSAPNPPESGDVDCSNQLDITDAVYLINYIFAGGGAPCAACS